MPQDQKIKYAHPQDFLRKATAVATYYGFSSITKALEEAKKEKRPTTDCSMEPGVRGMDDLGGSLTGALKTCVQWNIAVKDKQPALVFSTNVSEQKKSPKHMTFGLHVVGTSKSVAEAMVLRTALAICEDIGVRDINLRLNSIGDRDSVARFARELGNYFRKHSGDLPAGVKEVSIKEPFDALTQLLEKNHPLYDSAPRSVDYLSEASRRHLREVIEFVENLGITYEMDDRVIGNKNCYSQTVFEVRGNSKTIENAVIGRGGRYDEFPKRFFKSNMPAVGLVLSAESAGTASVEMPKVAAPRPKLFFVQLGFEARLKSLSVVETLRHARIPLRQSLSTESLTEQLVLAERMRIPYSLIMGYKEVLENAVIVRNMETRAQDTVPISILTDHLRKILK